MPDVTITIESIHSPDAQLLLEELSSALESVTGNSGAASFDANEMYDPRAAFVVARDANGFALGCGAIRPLDARKAEMKRVYARAPHSGVGGQIVAYLERIAAENGFELIVLETRAINTNAVSFYLRNGYSIIPNYGKYADRDEAVCFEKQLIKTL